MIGLLIALLASPAMADDDPWGPLDIDDADDDPWGPVEPEEPNSADSPWQAPSEAKPASDDPWGELEPDTPDIDPILAPPPVIVQPIPSPEARPIKPRPTVSEGGGQVPWGYRIGAVGGTSTVRAVQKSLVGPDGGSHATVLDATWALERTTVNLGMPFATYRTPGGRNTDIGNLQLGFARLIGDSTSGSYSSSIGVEGHFNVGERAYTWINEADEIWPGAGVDVVYTGRVDGDWTILYRASVGAAGAAEFAPFPSWYVRVAAAAGVDRSFTDELGVTGEMSVAYWDPSPWEVSGLLRADVVDGLRIRGGLVLPVSSWVGWVPAARDAGVREATVVVDVSLAL